MEGTRLLYCVDVNVTPTSSNRCASPSNRHQRKTLFVVDVSVDWATGRRWQTKLLDRCKVSQIHGLPQERVKFLIAAYPYRSVIYCLRNDLGIPTHCTFWIPPRYFSYLMCKYIYQTQTTSVFASAVFCCNQSSALTKQTVSCWCLHV